MNLQNNQTELDETKPDKWAPALLIAGFVLVSLFGAYSIAFRLAGGWHLPPLILPMLVLGGICLFYGWFRVKRSNLETKRLFTATRRRIWRGALAGSATAFFLAMASQITDLNGSWVIAFLVLSLTWGLLIGFPFGGIGGLLLSSLWKNKHSVFIGGAISGALAVFWFLRFVLLGF